MKDFRLIISLPLLIPMMVGLAILYIFGIPFLLIGGKKAHPIFDAITKMIKD